MRRTELIEMLNPRRGIRSQRDDEFIDRVRVRVLDGSFGVGEGYGPPEECGRRIVPNFNVNSSIGKDNRQIRVLRDFAEFNKRRNDSRGSLPILK